METIVVVLEHKEERYILNNWFPFRSLEYIIEKKIEESYVPEDILENFEFALKGTNESISIKQCIQEFPISNNSVNIISMPKVGQMTKAAR